MSKEQLWRFLREPLLHFCLIGSLIFLVFDVITGTQETADDVIVVSSERVSQLRSQFEATWKRSPTNEELDNLIEWHVREEVYYRGALSLGLDRNDAVVRRRMYQKMEFLIDTGSYLEEPTPGELEAYFAANDQTYRRSFRLAIEQIYLGEKADPEKVAHSLAALNSDQDADRGPLGERTFLPRRVELSTAEVVDGIFGQGFFEKLAELPQGIWVGPVVSAFGVHLVHIFDRLLERTPQLSEVRNIVQKDWREARAIDVRENDYAQRRSRFVVEIERDGQTLSKQDP